MACLTITKRWFTLYHHNQVEILKLDNGDITSQVRLSNGLMTSFDKSELLQFCICIRKYIDENYYLKIEEIQYHTEMLEAIAKALCNIS